MPYSDYRLPHPRSGETLLACSADNQTPIVTWITVAKCSLKGALHYM